jgi:UDP-N-acetylglucosamine acyltransferase
VRIVGVSIHPLAVVDSSARLGRNVAVGPFAIIERDAELGDGCIVESHAVVKSGTTLGADNHLFEGAVLGGLPQHLRMPAHLGGVRIGVGNTFRENVTVHRGMAPAQDTVIGDRCLLMVGAHVAHDCCVGNQVVLANCAMLAGHVIVEERAFISGLVGVHQHCRIGRLAMVGGLARVIKDVPPFVTVDGSSGYIVGLNTIGLRRAGFSASQLDELKAAYRLIYRSGLKWNEILDQLRLHFAGSPAALYAEFLAGTTRGLTPERRLPPGATIKLHETARHEAPAAKSRAG